MCGNPFIPKQLSVTASSFVPVVQEKKATVNAPTTGSFGLDSLSLNNNFTPSTPYVHKFRTEMCKNFMLYGKCKYGDEVSKSNNNLRSFRITPSYLWGVYSLNKLEILKVDNFEYLPESFEQWPVG